MRPVARDNDRWAGAEIRLPPRFHESDGSNALPFGLRTRRHGYVSDGDPGRPFVRQGFERNHPEAENHPQVGIPPFSH